WLVNIPGDRSVSNAPHRLVNHKEGNQEPFARHDWLAKPVLDLDIEPRRAEDAVDEVFKFRAIDVVELVGGNDLDFGHEECGVKLRIREAPGDVAPRHTYLVQDIAIGGDDRMVRLASQHINRAAREISVFILSSEERAGRRLRYASAS